MTIKFTKIMTPLEARAHMLWAYDDSDKHHPGEAPEGLRAAIEALPDTTVLEALEPKWLRDGVRAQWHELIGENQARA